MKKIDSIEWDGTIRESMPSQYELTIKYDDDTVDVEFYTEKRIREQFKVKNVGQWLKDHRVSKEQKEIEYTQATSNTGFNL